MARIISIILFLALSLQFAAADELEPLLDSLLEGKQGCIIVASLPDCHILAEVGDSQSLYGLHPPGSVFKLVAAMAALNEDIATWKLEHICDNSFEWSDTVYACCLGGGHGRLDLTGAIKNSCNYYFYCLVAKGLTVDILAEHALNWHFGERPLHENDLPLCQLPDASADPFDVVIGQPPVAITVYHALAMACGLANHGEMPNWSGGDARFLPYNSTDIEHLRDALRRGTIDKNNIEYAGKTGTPSVPDATGSTHAWFIGWAPFNRPEYAAVVFLQRGYGSRDAEPIAKEVLRALLEDN